MLDVLRVPLASRKHEFWKSKVVKEKPITVRENWYGKDEVIFTVKGGPVNITYQRDPDQKEEMIVLGPKKSFHETSLCLTRAAVIFIKPL